MAKLKKNYGRKQQWREEAIGYIVESLTELGQKACRHAIEEREYTNRLYNLRDSIGSAVYVDGHIVPSIDIGTNTLRLLMPKTPLNWLLSPLPFMRES